MSIFALATAPGTSGLAVIRVSGKDAFKVAKGLTKFKKIKPRVANFSSFYDNKNQIIDKGIFIFFQNLIVTQVMTWLNFMFMEAMQLLNIF